jgi:hypothetical protein
VSRKQTFAIEFSITGVNMVRVDKNRKNLERGDAILEFAAALPLFILLLAGIGIFSWLFWAQAAADVAAMRALQEASVNRGADAINPGAGVSELNRRLDQRPYGRGHRRCERLHKRRQAHGPLECDRLRPVVVWAA